MNRTVLRGVGIVMLLAGCGSSLTATGVPEAPRGENCDFQVLSNPPPAGTFAEIGVIDVPAGFSRLNWTHDMSAFKEQIASQVCSAGGEAAIAQSNGIGAYVKATVIKYVATRPPPPAAPPAPAAASAGCQFDTQCKGDRVCVQGACVSPPAPASAAAPAH